MYKNRGMFLEEVINRTINYYAENKLAYIEKKYLPVKFSAIKNSKSKLKACNAFIYRKSTVDYTGCANGKFVAFEAKSTNEKSLPASNIMQHQIDYLKKISNNNGHAFFIIFFSLFNEFYFIDFRAFESIKNEKSYSYEKIKKIGKLINLSFPGVIDFLPLLK